MQHVGLSDFAVARICLPPKGQHGCCGVGTSPRPVIATRLIMPEEQLRVAGWSGELSWATFPDRDPAVSQGLALT
jgi:hypothetical protein